MVNGCFCFCHLLCSLSSRFAMPGNILITAMAMSLEPGLADGQGITAVPVLLYWTAWNSRLNASQRDCDLWMGPRGSMYTLQHL